MTDSYVRIYVGKSHHLADKRGYAYEHRLVAEKKLGRRLLPGEIVHHANHIKSDNDEDNIEVVSSRWHHNAEHRRVSSIRRAPGAPNVRIRCACGCGKTKWRFDKGHVERLFIHGHTSPRGADNTQAKLTAKQVRQIRRRYARGATQQALADVYGVSRANIGHIVRGAAWAHLLYTEAQKS